MTSPFYQEVDARNTIVAFKSSLSIDHLVKGKNSVVTEKHGFETENIPILKLSMEVLDYQGSQKKKKYEKFQFEWYSKKLLIRTYEEKVNMEVIANCGFEKRDSTSSVTMF